MGGRSVRLSVDKDPQDAAARRLRKKAELNAVNNGISVVPENSQNGHRSLAAAVTERGRDCALRANREQRLLDDRVIAGSLPD